VWHESGHRRRRRNCCVVLLLRIRVGRKCQLRQFFFDYALEVALMFSTQGLLDCEVQLQLVLQHLS
jgi:hypothetical protein